MFLFDHTGFLSKLFSVKQSAENTVPREQYDSLMEKATELALERDTAKEKLQKYEEWEKNPMAVLKHFIPDLEFRPSDLGMMQMEELMPYLADIHLISRSDAFNREIATLQADINDQIILTVGNERKADGLRQLHLFVVGMLARFNQLAAQYEKLKEPPKAPDATHALGKGN